jgi:ATP-dependent RNA helicase DeaD
MERYRVEVGHKHGVKPGNIVGAIANEAGLDGEHIGRIDIEEDYSLVDLPVGMPKDIFHELKKARVCGEALNISLVSASATGQQKPKKSKKKFDKQKKPRR